MSWLNNTLHVIVICNELAKRKLQECSRVLKDFLYSRSDKRVFIHVICDIESPFYLEYFRELISENIKRTLIVKHHKSLEEALSEIKSKEYKVVKI